MAEKEERKVTYVEEKRFSIITKESIKLIADSVGYSDISDDVAAILGEDVSYRLREATQSAAQFMKHARRRKMTVDDFNKALRSSDVQTVHGHRLTENLPFRQTKEGDIYFVEDPDVSFGSAALSNNNIKSYRDVSVKAHWLAVEGVSKVSSTSQGQIKPGAKKDDLQTYFDNVTNAILGFDDDAMKIAFQDLRANSQIVPLLPRIVNFILCGVKTVSYDVNQLMKLLHTVNALLNNSAIYLEPQNYLNSLVQAVSYCLVEPLTASFNPVNDHWKIRDYAARLLAKVVQLWSSPVNHLEYNTIKTLKETFYDLTKPFCCHYGAILGLKELGHKSVRDVVVPYLPEYWPHLISVLEENSYPNAQIKADAQHVYDALLSSSEALLKFHLKEFLDFVDNDDEGTKNKESASTHKVSDDDSDESSIVAGSAHGPSVNKLYKDMYEYFGDSLTARIPDLIETVPLKTKVFVPKVKEKLVTLSDSDATKSGEDLLEDFLEQVRKQEIIDMERKEQERIENEKKALVRKEIEEKRRLLQKKTEEEERIKQEAIERLEEQLQQEKMRVIEAKMAEQAEQRRQQRLIERRRKKSSMEDEDLITEIWGEEGKERKLRKRTEVKYAESSDSDLEDLGVPQPVSHASPSAGTSQGGGDKGIKMKIVKSTGLKFKLVTKDELKDSQVGSPATIYGTPPHTSRDVRTPKSDSHPTPPHYATPPHEAGKDFKQNKRRKQTFRTSASSFDAYEFNESDNEETKQMTFKQNYYSSEGESSDGAGHRKPLTLKLKVKDSKD